LRAFVVALASCGVSVAHEPNPKLTLTFIWHAGGRANLLQRISRQYTEQTGVEIKAVLPPVTNEWYQRKPASDLTEAATEKADLVSLICAVADVT
jgi:surfactin synthase thioesterase subunit